VSPVRYELGFYNPEDGILHQTEDLSNERENHIGLQTVGKASVVALRSVDQMEGGSKPNKTCKRHKLRGTRGYAAKKIKI
jgi:hypothetical protein